MSVLRRYGQLLARPGVTRAVTSAQLVRLPMGITPLALLLLVEEETGSYTTAGLTTGCYAVAVSLVAPLRSRMVDRSGMALVLATSGVVYPLALLGLLAAVLGGAANYVVFALAVASGLGYPPVAPVMRALWTRLVPDEAARRTAYSLESVLVETTFILGPLGVSVSLLVGSPAVAVVAAAALVATGSLGLAASPLVRAWVPDSAVRRGPAGPLVSPALRWLLAVWICLGISIGATEVALPAAAEAGGSRTAAGVLLAVWSLGSIVGGLWYGGRDFSTPAERQYPWLVALLAGASALPLLATGLMSLGVLLAVSGMAIAPLSTCNSTLVARLAPPGTVTEAFGWSMTFLFGGVSIGAAAGGAAVDAGGPRAALALAMAGGLAGLGVVLIRQRVPGRADEAASAPPSVGA